MTHRQDIRAELDPSPVCSRELERGPWDLLQELSALPYSGDGAELHIGGCHKGIDSLDGFRSA